MRRWILIAMAVTAAAVGWGGAATLADQPAPIQVGAYGNDLPPANLKFAPADITAHVGQLVVWTNKDVLVPHTATEDHHLWDLAGTYGQTPINPAGFSPGNFVERYFEAGTEHYFCRVHPVQMHGVIRVPVSLAVQTVKGKKRRHHKAKVTSFVVATWAPAAPATGEGFDVRISKDGTNWTAVRTATTETTARFKVRHGTRLHVEAHLRRLSDAKQATDWSPDATATG
jgi:plastocyanin